VFCERVDWSKPLTTSTSIKVENRWRKLGWRCITPSHSKPPVAHAQLKSHSMSNLIAHAILYGSFVSQKMPSFLLAGPASDRQNTYDAVRKSSSFVLRGARLCP
jgi:hypothetical protein